MATIPNQVQVHIVQKELADQLEALALQYEEVVQTLRWQAENLRSGFDLTLQVTATQVVMKKPEPTPEELDGDVTDEEVAEAFAEPERPTLGERMFAEKLQKVGLKPTTDPLPEDAIRLIDEMTKTDNKGEEE